MSEMPFEVDDFDQFAYESLWCMFYHGPTQDGDLPSKCGRTWLVSHGYADRGDGWNWLTTPGAILAIEIGMGSKKDKARNAGQR